MDIEFEELSRIVDEQFREFMAAQAVESDMELAYRFQLEEAMAASLALQPSSSDSSLQPPQSPPPISIDHRRKLADLRDDKFESGVKIKDLVVDEIGTKKVQVDGKRLIDDKILDLRRLQVLENRRAGGDSMERPNGEGSSSSKKEDELEVFRVYFKGLLSVERVRGPSSSNPSSLNRAMTMAGIGVAICDSRDEMVSEISKPLDLNKKDRISRQTVEWEALIEALDAAIALNLKRIVIYCDYYPIYQYVSSHWRAKQQKIVNFLDKVNFLQQSFTYCEFSHIASKDVKFACELAREAIKSQISKVEAGQEKFENCVICLEEKCIDQFFSIEGCAHEYCYSCIKQHAEVKLHNGVLPKCPHEGCGNSLTLESCEEFLTPHFADMMRQQLKEDSIPVTEKVYCPYPKCSTLMSKTELLKLPRFINKHGARTCYKCRGNFCISCRVPWHENMNCAEYKRRNPTPIVEESKLKNLAASNMWRQCVKCKHMIELAAGCYHMTCRCGYEFCYTCGAEWKNKKQTCTCALWDEENIMDTEEDDDDDDDEDFEEDDVVFIDDDYDSDDDHYF